MPPGESQTNFTHDGLAAAESGAISAGQESTLQTTVSGPGVLGFWWKVSSGTNSGLFTFSIDAVTNAVISGEVDWRLETFSVPVGLHTLKWTYAKSASRSGAGLDAAWLDQVWFHHRNAGPSSCSSPPVRRLGQAAPLT